MLNIFITNGESYNYSVGRKVLVLKLIFEWKMLVG